MLSTQILQEFYVTVTRKLEAPLSPQDALAVTRNLAEWPVVRLDPALIFAGIELSIARRLSFWDALVVQAALHSRCERLVTEDLQNGMVIEGLRIENPFVGGESPGEDS